MAHAAAAPAGMAMAVAPQAPAAGVLVRSISLDGAAASGGGAASPSAMEECSPRPALGALAPHRGDANAMALTAPGTKLSFPGVAAPAAAAPSHGGAAW
jgi:hypothetical protein